MAAPPSEAGAVHDSVTWPLPGAAAKLRGALSPPVVPDSETLTSSEGSLGAPAVSVQGTPHLEGVRPAVGEAGDRIAGHGRALWNSSPAKSVQRP